MGVVLMKERKVVKIKWGIRVSEGAAKGSFVNIGISKGIIRI